MNAASVALKTVPIVKCVSQYTDSSRECCASTHGDVVHSDATYAANTHAFRYLRANGHANTPIVLAEIPPKCESDWYNTATLQKSELGSHSAELT